MILPVDYLAAFLIIIAVLAVMGLSFFYDHFESRYYAHQCARSLFYCKKCNCIQSVNEEVELHECPECGTRNGRLKF